MTVPASPQINAEAISAYVEMVFGYLEGFVPIRALAETGTGDRSPQASYRRIADLSGALVGMAAKAADDHRGLYVVPGTVEQPGSAKAADIIQTGVLVVDLDTGDIDAAVAHLTAHVGPPTLDVASGGTTEAGQTKRHLYWKLTEAASRDDLERIRALRETLAAKVGGDSAFKSLHQPIRVPGTIHGKNGVKAPVRLLARTAREYELDDFEVAVEAMPALVKEEDAATASCGIDARPSARALMTNPIREGAQDEVSRFEALSSVIGHWVRSARLGSCSLEEAWTAVRDYNVAMIRPPWDEARLRREFGALHRKDQAAYPDVPALRAHRQDGLIAQSEDALAAEFVSAHGDRWRFVAAWGAWQGWTGTHWTRDEAGAVHEDIRLICRAAARRCVKPHEARRLASDKTIRSVGRIVSTDPAIATRSGDWDTCPMLLNTPAGTIDLETGETLPHRPDDLLSQITAVAPGGDCPGWLAFLDEITGGDRRAGCLSPPPRGILPDRVDRRAGLRLPSRRRRQREVGLPADHRRCARRLRCDGDAGYLHGDARRAASDRTGRSACGPPGDGPRDGVGPDLGRGADQDRHRRRKDPRQLHAVRPLRISSPVQACGRRQPQALAHRVRRGDAPSPAPRALRRHDPRGPPRRRLAGKAAARRGRRAFWRGCCRAAQTGSGPG